MLELGTKAPAFSLANVVNGEQVSLEDYSGADALLVIFSCNHCPYVKHLIDGIVQFANDYESRGLKTVMISSNDVENYPDDRPGRMKEFARQHDFPFPYLYDETQEVAKAYRAACTPDFFLFDNRQRLAYRGQFDGSRPGKDQPVTGEDLRRAADLLLEKGERPEQQIPSMGCNIKWKPGNEPDYFG